MEQMEEALSSEVIECETYALQKFIRIFKLYEIENLQFHLANMEFEALPPVDGVYCEKYDFVLFIEGSNFEITMIVSVDERIVRKMKIKILDNAFQDELQACLNYLSRKKCLKYAIETLKDYVKLLKHRERIGSMVLSEGTHNSTLTYVENKGLRIRCGDLSNDDISFTVHWVIWWSVRELTFFDILQVELNKTHTEFYRQSKPVFLEMLNPTTDFETKKIHWTLVMRYFKEHIENKERVLRRVHNIFEKFFSVTSKSTTVIEDSDDSDDEDDSTVRVSGSDGKVIILD